MSRDKSIIFSERAKDHAPVRGATGAPKPGPRSAPKPSPEARAWGDRWVESICQPRAFRDTNQQAIYLMVAVDAVLEAGAFSVSLEEEIARVLSGSEEACQVIPEAASDRELTSVEEHLMEPFDPAKEEITEPVVEWLRRVGPHGQGDGR